MCCCFGSYFCRLVVLLIVSGAFGARFLDGWWCFAVKLRCRLREFLTVKMISEAISTLKERTGSSQPAIAKFIEDKYKNTLLPSNFKKLLSVQLKRFVKSERLIMVKNSYKLSSTEKLKLAIKETQDAKVLAKKPIARKEKTDKKITEKAAKTKRLSHVKTPEALKKANKNEKSAKTKRPSQVKTPDGFKKKRNSKKSHHPSPFLSTSKTVIREGVSANMYTKLGGYWRRRGYQRLNESGRRRRNQVELGSTRRRRFWRIKIKPKLKILKISSPKKFFVWLRDAYVKMMLGFANSRVIGAGGYGAGVPNGIAAFGKAHSRSMMIR
ncbi:hypothetical protein GH714_037757 [Hevea brasiliensis]|uniref:H15 domain-containing protein n=1 Tax=Hevea brasiliensis TaxID=3981 RepID=A0A6A6LUS7_HEVBR|nr:hypothetical protein GH714_037757 [Hevea brasiliensis]